MVHPKVCIFLFRQFYWKFNNFNIIETQDHIIGKFRVKCKLDRSILLIGYAQRIWSASLNVDGDAKVIALVTSALIDTLLGLMPISKRSNLG